MHSLIKKALNHDNQTYNEWAQFKMLTMCNVYNKGYIIRAKL